MSNAPIRDDIYGLPKALTGDETVTVHQGQFGTTVLATLPLSQLINYIAKALSHIVVTLYGADPTGIKDSSQGFALASSAAGNDGIVYVPAGTYLLTASDIGSITTCYHYLGDVAFTGGGSLAGGVRQLAPLRIGDPVGGVDWMQIAASQDGTQAKIRMRRQVSATTDRSGCLNCEVDNTSNFATTAIMSTAWHRGANTGGFPGGITSYSTASNLNGATVQAMYICALTPAHDIAGQQWNSGIACAMEINCGNRWGEFGLVRDPTIGAWVGGLTLAPDVVDGPDGGLTGYPFNAQFGLLFGPGQQGNQKRKWWIPILIEQDAIPDGGIGIHARGATSSVGPLSIMEAALNWQNGIDLSKATFSNYAFLGQSYAFTLSGVVEAMAYTSSTGDIVIKTNMQSSPSNAKYFSFRANGNLGQMSPTPPSSSSATGNPGDQAWDSTYEYRCVSVNCWQRWPRSAF